ncbi:unnamed protein product [Amaranthus hypochondriacus]
MNKIRIRTDEFLSHKIALSGVNVKSWVVELYDPTLESTGRESEIEKSINIKLSYKDCRKPEEEQIEIFENFEITEENYYSNLDLLMMVYLERLDVDSIAHYCAINVVTDSCAILWNENRKSLAMDVDIFIFKPEEFEESKEDEDEDECEHEHEHEDVNVHVHVHEDQDEVLKMTEEDRKMIENVLIDNRVKSVEKNRKKINEICLICQDKFDVESDNNNADDVIILGCHHAFHQNCLIPWVYQENTCPLCRYQILLPDPKKRG